MEYNKPRYNPKIHHRRSIRLKGYDYSQAGLYFITICSQNRICRFGEIVVVGVPLVGTQTNTATMILNHAGKMVEDEWLALVDRFPNMVLHEYIIMPNHFHCILEIVGVPLVGTQNVGACSGHPNVTGRPQGYAPTDDTQRNDTETMLGTQNDDGVPKNKTIGDMMDAFKSITTVKYIDGVKNRGWDWFDGKIWQRDYYEHIIRDEES